MLASTTAVVAQQPLATAPASTPCSETPRQTAAVTSSSAPTTPSVSVRLNVLGTTMARASMPITNESSATKPATTAPGSSAPETDQTATKPSVTPTSSACNTCPGRRPLRVESHSTPSSNVLVKCS